MISSEEFPQKFLKENMFAFLEQYFKKFPKKNEEIPGGIPRGLQARISEGTPEEAV